MKVKSQKKKAVSINARLRSTARNFSGRIWLSDKRLHIVKGVPDANKLFYCLERFKAVPVQHEEPTPVEMGFSGSDVSEVNIEELNKWNVALNRWQNATGSMSDKKRQK